MVECVCMALTFQASSDAPSAKLEPFVEDSVGVYNARAPSFIKIEDDVVGYPLNVFCIPHHYANDLERVMIPHGVIKDRYVCFAMCELNPESVAKLAHDIVHDFGSRQLTVLCVLKVCAYRPL